MDFCKKKVEKITSIVICNEFTEFKLTLYSLEKYYKKKFSISSSNGSTILNLKYCISYFTYHKPIFGLIKFDE